MEVRTFPFCKDKFLSQFGHTTLKHLPTALMYPIMHSLIKQKHVNSVFTQMQLKITAFMIGVNLAQARSIRTFLK